MVCQATILEVYFRDIFCLVDAHCKGFETDTKVGTLQVNLVNPALSVDHAKTFRYLTLSIDIAEVIHQMTRFIFSIVQLVDLVDLFGIFELTHSV